MDIILQVEGMTCIGCETRIENAVKKLNGIVKVKAIYSSSNVYVTYNADAVKLNTIIKVIEKLDYIVKNKPQETSNNIQTSNIPSKKSEWPGVGQIAGIAVIILALYVIIKNTIGFDFIPEVNQSMGYGILVLIGLLTSLHCVGMCGGINLSVCVGYKTISGVSGLAKFKPSILYNLGRVISYTVVGGIVGGIGSVVSFSGSAKGVVAILSGVFMVIMGINMLNVLPVLRKLNPRMPKIFAKKIHQNSGSRGPLIVGLLNGLMPCGPLQAMQLYALGTGSTITGALSMFLFSLGTVPLMFGIGAVSSLLSRKFTHKMMKISAVLVLLLGIIMLNRGLSLSGFNARVLLNESSYKGGIAKIEGNIQVVTTKLDSGRYSPITVQKGMPVKWIITADSSDINGCNNRINIPEYNIENVPLKSGENVIEFTPDREGKFVYSCWMGMISSTIKVVRDLSSLAEDIEGDTDLQVDVSNFESCCG
ncbi:sulfite exporter TauE/SafE family protein [Ruminiclostridium josui]|uniref:urease accessory protein UreH domain-containing protein n=2 Tax=Ruminiclostridium josui TaxID=1499 RepID=UPI0004667AC6|nr:sulfite exporter TauE/SafE family protein [Ruminiclostridium josui]